MQSQQIIRDVTVHMNITAPRSIVTPYKQMMKETRDCISKDFQRFMLDRLRRRNATQNNR